MVQIVTAILLPTVVTIVLCNVDHELHSPRFRGAEGTGRLAASASSENVYCFQLGGHHRVSGDLGHRLGFDRRCACCAAHGVLQDRSAQHRSSLCEGGRRRRSDR